jgi:hypothetical protein
MPAERSNEMTIRSDDARHAAREELEDQIFAAFMWDSVDHRIEGLGLGLDHQDFPQYRRAALERMIDGSNGADANLARMALDGPSVEMFNRVERRFDEQQARGADSDIMNFRTRDGREIRMVAGYETPDGMMTVPVPDLGGRSDRRDFVMSVLNADDGSIGINYVPYSAEPTHAMLTSRRVNADESQLIRLVPTPEQVTRLIEEARRRDIEMIDGSRMMSSFYPELPKKGRRRFWIDNSIALQFFILGFRGIIDPRDYDDAGRILDIDNDATNAINSCAKEFAGDPDQFGDAFLMFRRIFAERWLRANGFKP